MYLVVDKTCQKLPSKSCVVNIVERQDCGIVSRRVHAIQKIDRVCTYVLLCDCKINVIDHVGCFYGRGRGVAVQVT